MARLLRFCTEVVEFLVMGFPSALGRFYCSREIVCQIFNGFKSDRKTNHAIANAQFFALVGVSLKCVVVAGCVTILFASPDCSK